MIDPTRIPGVLEAVRRAWEGQPDLSLPTLFGVLANRGIGWGSTDEDLLAALAAMGRTRPGTLPRIDDRVTARFLLLTESPAHRVTVDPWRVIVRSTGLQPVAWEYSRLRPAAVGAPLVIADADGIDHRLGVISSITLIDGDPVEYVDDLSGLGRAGLGDRMYLVRLADDALVLVGHRLHVVVAGRRELSTEDATWDALVECRPGAVLRIHRPAGAGIRELGVVESILVVEDQASTG